MIAYPLPDSLLGIPGVQPLELEVAEVVELGPHMRCIQLTAHDPLGSVLSFVLSSADSFVYKPGQDVMLVLGLVDGRPLSRRYTIRGHNAQRKTLELNVVAHGVEGPGARWAAGARPGDRVNGVGPRGKIFLNPDADWHVFVGDESAAPGYLAMLEALPEAVAGVAYLGVTSAEDQLPTSAAGRHQVQWLHRGEVPATDSSQLVEAISSMDLPAGRGHVYIAGEVQVVAEVHAAALARGLAAEQLSPKAYWGRGRANAPRGEPD